MELGHGVWNPARVLVAPYITRPSIHKQQQSSPQATPIL
jgi:hypothetical protein